MSVMLAVQHSQKLFLLTLRACFKKEYFQPSMTGSVIVLVNSFAVAAYNLSLIAICIHLYLLIQAAGQGYDHIKAQVRFIHGICALSFVQLLHVASHNRNTLSRIPILPFLWIQHVILVLQVVVCPFLIMHLLCKCYRARERTYEFLRKSSISSSLMWRLVGSLIGVVGLSGYSLYLQLSQSLSTGSDGTSFPPFPLWNATGEQLAYRYRVGYSVGPVLMLVFLTAQEPSDYVREKWYAFKDVIGCRMQQHRRRKSSVPWLDVESSNSGMPGRYCGRDSLDTQFRCGNPGLSAVTASSLDPKDSARIDSVDMMLPVGTRRVSEVLRSAVMVQEKKSPSVSRSASVAAEIKASRSDSLPEIVIIKDSL